ncbi:Na(+)/H(+) exchange regulatory cofactor NHE-RF2 isoform X2 [Delphinapterus leucas]|uniref:Na(+)/H(+) exchange regulatory cofactor NHE-RF2 isoform X2 n=1 Tax=Delphinapterus leucas TaxID=9749 RepID=A0A2Y9Q464_DELLE|nr:Na(+)/H(+) exchange regulatory cofactor NHE-RF2 isoform X2 [Delphinapterus leucas]
MCVVCFTVRDEGAHPPCPVGGRAEVGVQAPRALLALSASVSSCPGQGGGGGQGRTLMWLAPPFRELSGLSVVTQPRSDWAGVAAAAVQLIVTVMMGDRPEQRRGSQRCQGCRGVIDPRPSSPSQPAHASTSSSGGLWGLRVSEDVNGPLRELRPRLCHLQKGPQGYGFNLHSDKSRPGQYIRSVDPGSPAAHSGLRAQDRLIEVNGQNVEGLRHAEVVASIKAREDEARLLVVDPETDEHFKRLRVTPTEEHVEGPLPSPVTNGTSSAQLNGGSVCSSRSDLPGLDKDTEDGSTWKRDPFQESGLHLSPTAAEAKEKVRATRVNKRAPQMDWNRKREIFSNF